MDNWINQIEEVVSNLASAQGCRFYDVELTGTGNGRVLAIYIDKESGVGIEDCSIISKGLNEYLDENDIVPGGEYQLEVSSPGLDRKLKKMNHFSSVVNEKAAFELNQNLATFGMQDKSLINAKKFEAVVLGTEIDSVLIFVKEVELKVPMNAIVKAKLVFDFNAQLKKHKSKNESDSNANKAKILMKN